MNKELIFTVIRTLLTAIGAFLIGRTFWNVEITGEWMQQLSGVIMVIVSVVWGIVDKTVTIEKWESGARQLIAFIGGIFIARGVATVAQVEEITGAVLLLVNYLSSYLSKKKSNDLQLHKIDQTQLKTLDE